MLYRGTAALIVLWLTLGQRWTFGYSGNRVEWLEPLAIGAVALLWVSGRPRRSGVRGLWVNTVGPLLTLMFLLPLLGVMFAGYGTTTLYAWTAPAAAVALLGFAYLSAAQSRSIRGPLFVAILAHGLYGLGQTLDRLSLIPPSSWAWASSWDQRVQATYQVDYVIVSRSTGLFINANMFGMWSVLAVIYAAEFLGGWQRRVAVLFGLTGVAGSQSRTAWFALGVCGVVLLVRVLRDGRIASRVVAWLAAAALAVTVLALTGALPRLVESDLVQRLAEGLSVLGGGVHADTNLGARVSAWGQAWAFSAQHPFGTLGPPQVLFGSFIDNEYVALFLQGSILLVAAYLLALTSPLVLRRRGVPHATALATMAAVVAVTSFTMGPLELPECAALLWLAAGWAVGSSDRDDDRDTGGAVAALARGVAVERRATATTTG